MKSGEEGYGVFSPANIMQFLQRIQPFNFQFSVFNLYPPTQRLPMNHDTRSDNTLHNYSNRLLS